MTEHVGKPFEISKLTEVLIHHTGWASRAPAAPTNAYSNATPHPAVADIEKLSDVIDVAGALAWVGDDIEMYRHLMDSFLDDVRSNADQLQGHFDRDEKADAVRVLHTLKGLARTVGALELSQFAANAEARFKHALTQEDAQTLVTQMREHIDRATLSLLEVAKKIDAALNSV
jgi:HPt (histidine-containing phosphotransfer) domain-containing protein